MKSAPAEYPNKSAPPQGHFNTSKQLPLFPNEAPVGRFMGTTNPRHVRVLKMFLKEKKLTREEVDKIARASNGPDLIADLRQLGLELPCRRFSRRDFDGRFCRPGRYEATDNDIKLLEAWFQEFGHAAH
nr:hypothetical protein [uncultured Deefgea sp.]